jgi:hypothetical protein
MVLPISHEFSMPKVGIEPQAGAELSVEKVAKNTGVISQPPGEVIPADSDKKATDNPQTIGNSVYIHLCCIFAQSTSHNFSIIPRVSCVAKKYLKKAAKIH